MHPSLFFFFFLHATNVILRGISVRDVLLWRFCNRHCHSCHFDALQLIVREHGGVNCPYSCPTNQREPDATQHLISLPFMQLASIICAHQGKLQFLFFFFPPSKFQHRQHGKQSKSTRVFVLKLCPQQRQPAGSMNMHVVCLIM